jgi:hypothetical protein
MKDLKKLKDWLLIVLVIFLCLQSLFLAHSNRKLRHENRKLHFLLYTPTEAVPRVQRASMLHGLRLLDIESGAELGIHDEVDHDRLLLCIFSTDCYSCDAAAEIWNEVYDEFGDMVTVRGISKNPAPEIEHYVNRNQVKFPVYRYEDPGDVEIFTGNPQTVLVEKGGGLIFSLDGIPNSLKNKILEDYR